MKCEYKECDWPKDDKKYCWDHRDVDKICDFCNHSLYDHRFWGCVCRVKVEPDKDGFDICRCNNDRPDTWWETNGKV